MENAEMTGSTAGLEAQLDELAAQAQLLVDIDDHEGAQLIVDQALLLERDQAAYGPASVRLSLLVALLVHLRDDNIESSRQASSALAIAKTLGDPNLQAHAYLALARASLAVSDNDHTLAALETAWPEARDGTDLKLRFWCQILFGLVHVDPEKSLEWDRQAQATALAIGSGRLQALAASNLAGAWYALGVIAFEAGDHDAARAAWTTTVAAADEAIDMIGRFGAARWLWVAVTNRGGALVGLERDEEALACFAAELHRTAGNNDAMVNTVTATHMARSLRRRADLTGALAEARRGIEVGEAGGVRNYLIPLYELACDIAEQCGDLASALAYCRRQHALHIAVGTDRAEMRSKALAVRLATERAQAEALAERERARRLSDANQALMHRAEILGREAMQDPLTGLANRRRLDLFLERAHADARAMASPLWVAMLDIDHFKAINDGHSHAVGDCVLRQVGALLASASRDTDLPARYGGEEFVIVFANVTAIQALDVAERLRKSIQEFDWTLVAPSLTATVSIGMCDISGALDPATGLAAADRLLYRAKAEGRNRVVSAQLFS